MIDEYKDKKDVDELDKNCLRWVTEHYPTSRSDKITFDGFYLYKNGLKFNRHVTAFTLHCEEGLTVTRFYGREDEELPVWVRNNLWFQALRILRRSLLNQR